ncbi:MAG: uroporphyrinogen-III C-methyltransferase [Armatimonadetes bacterium]|nr:uroporphyrinogen-III C-methyltransferase [Armatimonadota bacterium]
MAKVYLVGAGPGDPGLLTIKGLECVRKADVVVYDRLAHPSILTEAKPDAELIYVGKAFSAHTMKQEDINALLVEKAREGKIVTRLKGGDPFVFGRGGEEAETLHEAGIPFEIVPGITSAIAVPAYAGIPVTHRGLCATLGIITGHEDPTKGESHIKWDKIATGIDTLVFLMGVENLPNIVKGLTENGRCPSTPVALIRWGTRSEQETLIGTLENIVELVKEANFKSPAVTVIGEVVNLREKLQWFDNKPLFGKRVLVTRTRDQASALSELLREHGAEPIEFPVIKICPMTEPTPFEAQNYDWLLFTSANAVHMALKQLISSGQDIRALAGPKIGAIGPKTAEALAELGLRVDFTPTEFVAEAVVDQFPENPSGKHILILCALEAREVLPEKLTKRGALVDIAPVYRTEIENSSAHSIREMLLSGEIDIITFTSSSTVTNLITLIGEEAAKSLPASVQIACIGPITAQTAAENGLKPSIVAEDYTVEGLVAAILAAES